MQALSFTVHIPLGVLRDRVPGDGAVRRVALPAHRRPAVPHARAALDAGDGRAVRGRRDHRHDPQLRDGAAVAELHRHVRRVFGLGFAIEGFSFFIEAIFIGIYVYGWDRLSPRAHLLSGIPIVITGFTGSLMVIAVNAWMNHPGGFRLRDGKVVDVDPFRALFGNSYLWHELIHMYVAGYMVTGFVLAGVLRVRAAARALGTLRAHRARDPADDRRARLAGAGPGRRLGGARRRHHAADQARRDRGARTRRPRRARARARLVRERPGQVRDRDPAPALAARVPQLERDGPGARRGARRPSARRSTSCRVAFQTMVGIGTLLGAARRRSTSPSGSGASGCPSRSGSTAALVLAGPLSVVALIAGWVVTEVGRQPWVVYRVMRTAQAVTGAQRDPGRLRRARRRLRRSSRAAVVWVLRRLARAPLDCRPNRRVAARR